MDKQEAMQAHRTLMVAVQEIANDDEFDFSSGDLEEYKELGVNPTALHKKRADHEEAILTLTEEFAKGLSDEEGDAEKEPVKA